MTVKVPEFLPEPIVTDVGSVAEPELLDSLTSIPEAGAGPLSFIAPVVDVPPLTRAGIIVMEVIAGGLTVRLAVLDTEPNFAVIVTADWTLTPMVGTLNVAEALPDAILMDLGTVAEVPLLESETTTPPLPAGPFKTTVPVELAPPKTIDGVTDTIANIGVVSVRLVVWDWPFKLPVIVAAVCLLIPTVTMVNVAKFCPAVTVTVVGTITAGLLLEREITVPPNPAGPLRIMVPIEEFPPTTEAGFRVTDDSFAGVIVKVADLEVVPLSAVIVVDV